MFFSELIRRKKLILKNLRPDEINKQRETLINEFCTPDEFDLPQPEVTKELIDEKCNYYYKTILNNIEIETIFKEENEEILVSYKVNGSIFKKENFKLKEAIDIMAIVSLNFLNYISICKKDQIKVVFETSKESIAKVDNRLLNLCDTIFPFITFRRRSTYE